MAEFCLECWNRINKSEEPLEKYILSKDNDFCGGCGEWKPVIVAERKFYRESQSRYFHLARKMKK